jgi:cell division septation protein DedD
MHEAIDEDELEQKRDTELTLGPAKLFGLFAGLVLLCGLCFALGYAFGHHGSQVTPAVPSQSTTEAQAAVPVVNSRSKPSATAPAGPVAQQALVDLPASDSDGESSAHVSEAATSGEQSATSQAVRPALPSSPAPQGGASLAVKPANAFAGALMVQIAAVSNPEDAEVLVGALRRHGYAVSASRDAADRLLHVRIGPFSNRSEADTMREKLLNDGYNAIVQP